LRCALRASPVLLVSTRGCWMPRHSCRRSALPVASALRMDRTSHRRPSIPHPRLPTRFRHPAPSRSGSRLIFSHYLRFRRVSPPPWGSVRSGDRLVSGGAPGELVSGGAPGEGTELSRAPCPTCPEAAKEDGQRRIRAPRGRNRSEEEGRAQGHGACVPRHRDLLSECVWGMSRRHLEAGGWRPWMALKAQHLGSAAMLGPHILGCQRNCSERVATAKTGFSAGVSARSATYHHARKMRGLGRHDAASRQATVSSRGPRLTLEARV
jgi:hypothetical protein